MNLGAFGRLCTAAIRRFSHSRLKAIGALCILLALSCWALASPVGATPDEDYHLVSIWCGGGMRVGMCEPGDAADSRQVPGSLPVKLPCYATHSDQSAACQDLTAKSELVSTTRGNFTGTYPPVFYWFNGLFVGDSIIRAVLVMRMINAALFVAFMAAVYCALSPGLRRPMVLGAIVTSVPLCTFLVPSINPSSWAILSAVTFLACVLGYLTAEERRRRWTLGALAAVSMFIGVGARADAAIYAVIAIVVAGILAARRERGSLRRLAYPAVLALVALVAFGSVGQSASVNPSGAAVNLYRLARVIPDIPVLWTGAVGSPPPKWDHMEQPSSKGTWGLGWFDTAVPGVVWVGMWSICAALMFVAVTHSTRRRAFAVLLIGGAAVLIPAYMQLQTGEDVGLFIQPRYILPLVIMLIISAMVRLDGSAFQLTRGQRWIVVTVAFIANAAALYSNTRRYVMGIDLQHLNLDRHAEWWWPINVTPLMVVAAGSIAFGLGLVLITAEFTVPTSASDQRGVVGTVSSNRSGHDHDRTDARSDGDWSHMPTLPGRGRHRGSSAGGR